MVKFWKIPESAFPEGLTVGYGRGDLGMATVSFRPGQLEA